MYRVTTKRALDAHHAARSRRMAWRTFWRDVRALLPRFDWR